MKKKILFGASNLGLEALKNFKNEIAYFCDNDMSKVGTVFDGIEVIDFSTFKAIWEKYDVVITSMYHEEISEQLIENGVKIFGIYENNKSIYSPECVKLQKINLGSFFSTFDYNIDISNITFFTGGSTLLDYFFLRALAMKFNLKRYLEIGSFIGESIGCVSDICDHCISISLDDETLTPFFEKNGKENFSSYFMKDKRNIEQIKANTREIELNRFIDKVDLVFIDGDHSYEGVYNDTSKIMSIIDKEETFVVWHDFRMQNGKRIRTEVVTAVFDAISSKDKENIYICDSNLCGIYIPHKYKKFFEFQEKPNELYSYSFELKKVVKNILSL